MNDTEHARDEERFWKVAEPLLHRTGVTRSTMMGLPCLRLHGDFFASWDRRTGDLVVKLDAHAVTALISAGKATPFAPSGHPFREWASIPTRRQRSWGTHLEAALQMAAARAVSSSGSAAPRQSPASPRRRPSR